MKCSVHDPRADAAAGRQNLLHAREGGDAPSLLLVPLFMLAAMTLDTLGWRRLMGSPGSCLKLSQLLRIRIATEGIILSVPSGTVLSEPLTLRLLRTRCGLPAGSAVASMAARRCYIALTLGMALAASAAAGFGGGLSCFLDQEM